MRVQSLTAALWAASALAAPMLVKRQKAENTCPTNWIVKGGCVLGALTDVFGFRVPWNVCREGTDALPLCRPKKEISNSVYAPGTYFARGPNGQILAFPEAQKDQLPPGTYSQMQKNGDVIQVTLGVGKNTPPGNIASAGGVVPVGGAPIGGAPVGGNPTAGGTLGASNPTNGNNNYGKAESTAPVFTASLVPAPREQREGLGESVYSGPFPQKGPSTLTAQDLALAQIGQTEPSQRPEESGNRRDDTLRQLREQREDYAKQARQAREQAERYQRNQRVADRRAPTVVVDTLESRPVRAEASRGGDRSSRSSGSDWSRLVGRTGAYPG